MYSTEKGISEEFYVSKEVASPFLNDVHRVWCWLLASLACRVHE